MTVEEQAKHPSPSTQKEQPREQHLEKLSLHEAQQQRTVSPIDQQIVATRTLATIDEAERALKRARDAFLKWRQTPLQQRIDIVSKMLDVFAEDRERLSRELTVQMGRYALVDGDVVAGDC